MVISLRFVLFIDLFTVIVTTMELGTRHISALPFSEQYTDWILAG